MRNAPPRVSTSATAAPSMPNRGIPPSPRMSIGSSTSVTTVDTRSSRNGVLVSPEARNAANAISDARDALDGGADLDQGIEVGGKANIVPSDADGIAFSRTPQQVLRIVYLTNQTGVSSGGIFPNGMNGTLRTT